MTDKMNVAEAVLNELVDFDSMNKYLLSLLTKDSTYSTAEFKLVINLFEIFCNSVELSEQEESILFMLFTKLWDIKLNEDLRLQMVKEFNPDNVFIDNIVSPSQIRTEIVDSILSNSAIEDGSMVVACGAGVVRSGAFINKAKEKPHLLKLDKPLSTMQAIQFLKETTFSDNISLVMFTDMHGFEIVTIFKALIDSIDRGQIMKGNKKAILKLMKGDLSDFGIKNLFLIIKNP